MKRICAACGVLVAGGQAEAVVLGVLAADVCAAFLGGLALCIAAVLGGHAFEVAGLCDGVQAVEGKLGALALRVLPGGDAAQAVVQVESAQPLEAIAAAIREEGYEVAA